MQLLQLHLVKEEKKRLKSDIKSFDPRDAKLYYGLKVVEEYNAIKNGSSISPQTGKSAKTPGSTNRVKKIEIKIVN